MHLVGNNSSIQPTPLWSVGKCPFLHDLCVQTLFSAFATCFCNEMCFSLPHNPCCCSLPSPVCLLHLLICTCINSPPIACPPSSVSCWCILCFFLILFWPYFSVIAFLLFFLLLFLMLTVWHKIANHCHFYFPVRHEIKFCCFVLYKWFKTWYLDFSTSCVFGYCCKYFSLCILKYWLLYCYRTKPQITTSFDLLYIIHSFNVIFIITLCSHACVICIFHCFLVRKKSWF